MNFYDGRDPEYNEKLLSEQGIVTLLSMRDLCLLMRHSRLTAQNISVGYERNELQLEIWFLEKIVRLLDKLLIHKFNKTDDIQQFYSKTLYKDLGLDEIVPGRYFDKLYIVNNGYELIKSVQMLFTNFNNAISNDWKFL